MIRTNSITQPVSVIEILNLYPKTKG